MTEYPSTLDVLVLQESTVYTCTDYITRTPDAAGASLHGQEAESATAGTNKEAWREKICKWTYEVVDHFDYSRETASISLSYLDRFLATRQVNHRTFQLASMTTLYMAIKLNEIRPLRVACLAELSRGLFGDAHIQAMERLILRDLDWRVNPPTSQSFTRILFEEFTAHLPRQDLFQQEIAEVSNFFMELAVCDYFFTTRRPSIVACSSIMNAIAIVAPISIEGEATLAEQFQKFASKLLPHMNDDASELAACQERLRSMYHEALDQPTPPVATSTPEASSPVTVMATGESNRTWYQTDKRQRI